MHPHAWCRPRARCTLTRGVGPVLGAPSRMVLGAPYVLPPSPRTLWPRAGGQLRCGGPVSARGELQHSHSQRRCEFTCPAPTLPLCAAGPPLTLPPPCPCVLLGRPSPCPHAALVCCWATPHPAPTLPLGAAGPPLTLPPPCPWVLLGRPPPCPHPALGCCWAALHPAPTLLVFACRWAYNSCLAWWYSGWTL